MKKNESITFTFFLIIILFQISNQNFLQFDPKKTCPKTPLTPLGILISLAETEEDSIYESTLSPSEREKYEDIVLLKRSFSGTMSYIPQSFAPEDDEYWDGLNYLLIVFVIIAIFPIIFIIFYIFMRFVLKKCTGPKKISQVNKMYRNITWFIMIISTIITGILFAIVLGKSVAVGKNIEKTFDYADNLIAESDKIYGEINEVVEFYREKNLTVPESSYMANFKGKIENYIKNTSDSSSACSTHVFIMVKYSKVNFQYLPTMNPYIHRLNCCRRKNIENIFLQGAGNQCPELFTREIGTEMNHLVHDQRASKKPLLVSYFAYGHRPHPTC